MFYSNISSMKIFALPHTTFNGAQKIFIGISIVIFWNSPSYSQHTLMRTYNINDGLVSNQVRGFYQDQQGFIWIMTWEGLSRFDGHSFKNYTAPGQLAHPMVNAMIEGREGELYIDENDGTVDVITNGAVDISHRIKHKTAINKLIPDSSGKIFAPSYATGISFFDNGKLIPLNTLQKEISISDFKFYNNLFFVCGTFNGVLTRDHTAVKSWPGQTGEYNCLLIDSTTLWIGTPYGLLWTNLADEEYNLSSTSFHEQVWSKWNIKNLLRATDGSIYISAIGGMVRIMKDHTWRVYTRSDGLPSDYITSIFEDKKGYIWIGTDQGIARLDVNNTIDVFTITEKLSDRVISDIQPMSDRSALVISNGSVIRIHSGKLIERIKLPAADKPSSFLIIGSDTLVITSNGRRKVTDNNTFEWNKVSYFQDGFSIPIGDCIFSSQGNQAIISCASEVLEDTTMKVKY